MESVTNLVLSAIVSLTASFNDGLKAVERKEYDRAIAELSKVIEDKTPANPLKPLALFYRAQSHLGKKDAGAAKADIVALAECADEGILYDNAVALMKEAGDGEKDLLPRDSPERVWYDFIDDMAGQRAEDAKRRSTGQWLGTVDGAIRAGDGGMRFAEQMRRYQIIEQRIGGESEKGKAWLSLSHPDMGERLMDVEFARVRNKWLISGWSPFRNEAGAKVDVGKVAVGGERSNFARLRAISVALMAYAKDHGGAFPARLGDLIGRYVDDANALMWQGPDAGNVAPFVYCAGLTNKPGSAAGIVLAEPGPRDGRRDVIYANGRVAGVAEAELKEIAARQKWEIPDKPGASKVTRETIDELVDQLRRGSTAERKKARKGLYDLGVDAYPLLEKYRTDDDPEIQETLKDLFGRK